MESERRGLQRLLLRDTFDEFVNGCLQGANRGTFTTERQCSCDKHGGAHRICGSKRDHCVRGWRHGDAEQRLGCDGCDAAINRVRGWNVEYGCDMDGARSRL
jgi:hypothetical protein